MIRINGRHFDPIAVAGAAKPHRLVVMNFFLDDSASQLTLVTFCRWRRKILTI